MYLGAIIAGGALALLATHYSARDNIYVMVAVLLVVGAALVGGTGPALVVAVTVVVGDDLVLSGRLPPLEQWRDEVIFGTIAVTVGLLVAAKRKQQLEAERLAARERSLRTERDTILAAISHDVRSPLAVIIGSARNALTTGAHDVQRVLRRIDSAALQASQLIDLLVDLRSLEDSGMQLDLRRHDLRRTVEMAVEQMEGIVRNHRLRCVTPAIPIEAVYDEGRVQRVLQNLIGNAIKYSPDGGDIEVRLSAVDATARVTVRDHGIGIPEAERLRVFERGYRAQGTRGITGSGLGLFISAEIVKRHGGSISCDAAPGGGTIFEVRLPSVGVGAPAERVEQFPRDGTRTSAADGAIVDRDDRHELPRRAGEKRLVRAE